MPTIGVDFVSIKIKENIKDLIDICRKLEPLKSTERLLSSKS